MVSENVKKQASRPSADSVAGDPGTFPRRRHWVGFLASRLLAIALGFVVLGASLTGGVWAWAQVSGAKAIPRLVPYQGTLEQNGAAVDGSVDMAFSLFAVASGGSASWREAHSAVAVTNGRFTVMLGDQIAIPFVTMNAPELYLEVEVAGMVLGGRQRFLANPAAVAASHGVPPGAIMAYGGSTAPSGWLLCDGSEVTQTDFPALFAAIGTAHGTGGEVSTFNLPDYRGRFLRGVAAGMDRDPDRASRTASMPGGNIGDAVGSVQNDATGPHSHTVTDPGHQHAIGPFQYWCLAANAGPDCAIGANGSVPNNPPTNMATTGISIDSATGSSETRPRNASVNWIIKY